MTAHVTRLLLTGVGCGSIVTYGLHRDGLAGGGVAAAGLVLVWLWMSRWGKE